MKQPRNALVVKEGEARQDAVPVGDDIFMSRGISNSYLVTTPDGDVQINTGMYFEANEIKRRFGQVSGPTREGRRCIRHFPKISFVPRDGQHPTPIRTESGRLDFGIMLERFSERLSGAGIPNSRGLVCRRRNDPMFIRTELNGPNWSLIPQRLR